MIVRAQLLLLALVSASANAETTTPVGVVIAHTEVIAEEIALHGSLVAQRTSRLSSETEGLVSEITVDTGDVVETDDVVVRLDQRLAALARDTAQARLDEARARHAESVRRHAELAALAKTQHIATTAVAAARSQIDIDAALVSQGAAEYARTNAIALQHVVRAPFAGVVRRKLVERGEWVETSTALVELVDIDVLRVEVPVPQFYFASVDERTSVSVRMDALPDVEFDSNVTRKIPISDAASRTFLIRVDIPNSERRLAPGMSARVILKIGSQNQEPVLVLPRDAIVRKADGSTSAWVIEIEDGVAKAVPRQITIGRSYRESVEILGGTIAIGDQVVVRGNEILRPGQSVRVAEQPMQAL